jgi:two-component system, chemotaxis family, protein-glutamate methylesterase/glutaminase
MSHYSEATIRQGNPTETSVPVICIGLSAGGIMPLRTIMQQLSPNLGMAIVIIPHLSRTRPTWLPWLLSSWSAMPMEEVGDGMSFQPNHIYVIPRGQEIAVADNHFTARPRSKSRGWSDVITIFLNSLVSSRHHPCIAVLLSGLDADGAAALAGLHELGGLIIVQDPRTANYNDMPRSAIQTGYVDYVVPAELIPTKIEEIVRGRQHRAATVSEIK